MTTPPSETQAQSETLEQIAERAAQAIYNIVCFQCSEPFCKHWEAQAATDIAFLLRNERERCAKVAEAVAPELPRRWNVDAGHFASVIAAAIRGNKDAE